MEVTLCCISPRTLLDSFLIEVMDDGPGVPEELAEQIFEQFFTTKPSGRGTGLGLPIVKKIIDEHGGTLTLGDGVPLDPSGRIGASATVRLDLLDPEISYIKEKLAV